jgi:hypothetical protein
MSAITIFENEFAVLSFHPEKKIVHHRIKKFVHGNDLKNILDQGYEQIKKNSAKKWLSDDRNNNALTKEDEHWAINDWFPRVLKAGWKYWAIVMPEKVVGQMNMKEFKDNYSKAGVTVDVFTDPESALKWLESVD